MNKLTKTQEKRFDEKFTYVGDELMTYGTFRKGRQLKLGIKPKQVKQHLADELSRQREEILNRLAHAIAAKEPYKQLKQ